MQKTTFPFFEKESPSVGKIENRFITIQWLTFSYMSQFVFVNISFIWSGLLQKQKWPFRSALQCRERLVQVGFFKKEAKRGQHHYFQIVYRL